ncbi:MAG: hypothetical protein HKP01_10070, partial [Gemmatimonadetes bacterium]|nr:hypothetical protein [Gemmatimonadota bacterium]
VRTGIELLAQTLDLLFQSLDSLLDRLGRLLPRSRAGKANRDAQSDGQEYGAGPNGTRGE